MYIYYYYVSYRFALKNITYFSKSESSLKTEFDNFITLTPSDARPIEIKTMIHTIVFMVL